jgi:predicted transcriptional regulator
MELREIMSAPPITVGPAATIQEVARLLNEKQISGVPVVNAQGELLGLITELHLIGHNAPLREPKYISVLDGLIPINLEEHREYKERLREALATNAADLMDRTEIPIAAPDDPIEAAYDLLSKPGESLLPILEGEVVVGVVTRTDLVQLIGRLEGRLEG